MSTTSSNSSSGLAILAGTLLPTFAGAIAGIVVAIVTWDEGVSTLLQWVGGGLMGGLSSVLIAGMLAWHGATMAAGPHGEGAPLWGVFPGVVIGGGIMPVLTFILSLPAGEPVVGGLFGLIAGPILATLAWEFGYWGTKVSG